MSGPAKAILDRRNYEMRYVLCLFEGICTNGPDAGESMTRMFGEYIDTKHSCMTAEARSGQYGRYWYDHGVWTWMPYGRAP